MIMTIKQVWKLFISKKIVVFRVRVQANNTSAP